MNVCFANKFNARALQKVRSSGGFFCFFAVFSGCKSVYGQTLDYFLPCFLRGNLLDVVASDVSPRLAANYICSSPAAELRNRFSLAELTVLSDYLDLISVARGWRLEIEVLAKQQVIAAMAQEE